MPFDVLARLTHILALTIALAVAMAGCGDAAPGGDPVARAESPVTDLPEATFPNDVTVCNYFVDKGLTSYQAAGIVGNLDQESGASPTAVESGGPGRGIAQWSTGGRWDTDSGDNAVAYASQQGQSVWALQLQLDFIWYELTTFSGYGLASLRGSANVTDATVAFETDFEGCGTCDQSTRIAYAEAVLPQCATTASPDAGEKEDASLDAGAKEDASRDAGRSDAGGAEDAASADSGSLLPPVTDADGGRLLEPDSGEAGDGSEPSHASGELDGSGGCAVFAPAFAPANPTGSSALFAASVALAGIARARRRRRRPSA